MNLLEKLPHKAPALLIGEALEIGGDLAVCPISPAIDESLAPGGKLPAPLGLEAIAQCAALWMYWKYRNDNAEGMLVQCRDFAMNVRTLDLADGLTARAHPISVGSATGLYQFGGQVRNARDEILAHGTFMIYAREDA